jgi:exonuclease VII small subunit
MAFPYFREAGIIRSLITLRKLKQLFCFTKKNSYYSVYCMSNKTTSIEEKLSRLKQIHDLLLEQKVTLTESMELLKEAATLKTEIELALKDFENQLTTLQNTTI